LVQPDGVPFSAEYFAAHRLLAFPAAAVDATLDAEGLAKPFEGLRQLRLKG
jgi:hypothetical protein